jgi:3-deoxy-D-manno-octulosonate 8-phosphate phosphatase KdsC-like HAD superfamily phosphatase
METTTEKLGLRILEQAEEMKLLKREISTLKAGGVCLVEEIEKLRQQLAQREAEVATMHDVLKQWGACKTGTEEEKVFNSAMHIKHNVQATAQAHDAKVREQAIRECSEYLKNFWYDSELEQPSIRIQDLLNKPESELENDRI